MPEAEPRAQRIRRFLRQLFDKTYGFTLEALTKKPLKESLKALSEYEAFSSDFVVATVVRQSLGGHAMPVDAPARRVLHRLGLVDADADFAAIRSLLERAIPKNRGAEFVDLIEELAHDTCVDSEPDCPRCELRKLCPTAHARKEEAAAAAKQAVAQAKAAARETATAAKEAARAAKAAAKAPPAPAKPKEKPRKKEATRPTKPKGRSGGK